MKKKKKIQHSVPKIIFCNIFVAKFSNTTCEAGIKIIAWSEAERIFVSACAPLHFECGMKDSLVHGPTVSNTLVFTVQECELLSWLEPSPPKS